jgi:hypothetical protein
LDPLEASSRIVSFWVHRVGICCYDSLPRTTPAWREMIFQSPHPEIPPPSSFPGLYFIRSQDAAQFPQLASSIILLTVPSTFSNPLLLVLNCLRTTWYAW